MPNSRAYIVATVGPTSIENSTLAAMIAAGLDIVRLNFAWLQEQEPQRYVDAIRAAAKEAGVSLPIIADLPGPRQQEGSVHTYDPHAPALTPEDEGSIAFAAAQGLEYIALSFVGRAADVEAAKALIKKHGGSQKVIAKIERQVALEHIDEIIAACDALMVARGDLGSEVPLEEIPFVQTSLVVKANAVGKPVIIATQMLESMVEHPVPTRAEVTDVASAILLGADAVMLSEETASGKHPVEAVAMMERIVRAAEKHMGAQLQIHTL